MFWFTTGLKFIVNFLQVKTPSTDGRLSCTIPWPMSIFIAQMLFMMYTIFVTSLILLAAVGGFMYYRYIKSLEAISRLTDELQTLLRNVYIDKD